RRDPSRGVVRLSSWVLWHAIVAALLVLAQPVRAQSPWTAQLVIPPFPSPFLAEWERNPHMALFTVAYAGPEAVEFRIEGTAISRERGLIARGISPSYMLPGGFTTRLFTADEILD